MTGVFILLFGVLDMKNTWNEKLMECSKTMNGVLRMMAIEFRVSRLKMSMAAKMQWQTLGILNAKDQHKIENG
jgi:hypothetical protein